ncbi:MAG: polyketide synthase, partial [Pseudomonadota bacterium]
MPASILGMSCRLPGSDGASAFWTALRAGVCAIKPIGPDRFAPARYWHPDKGVRGKTYSIEAGLVDDLWRFDAEAFGLSPREAAQLDPQQRLMLEVGWEALEDAGLCSGLAAPDRIGVYVGGSSMDFANLAGLSPQFPDTHFMTGSTLSLLSNRLANAVGAAGPSMTIDTACSSSLHALAEAEIALASGRIDVAVVGGVNVALSPYPFIGFSQAQMLSPTGRCRAFGEGPDGYVRGEGAVAIVLARDGLFEDRARAKLLAVALSSDGRKSSIAVPSVDGQERVLRAALARAGVEADALAFVEAHGTGTAVGDPIEAEALGRVLGRARSEPLPIGSVKSNIGHLEPASGLAGLAKALLALERSVMPRSLFSETLNPAIPFEDLNLRVAQQEVAESVSQAAPARASTGRGGVASIRTC